MINLNKKLDNMQRRSYSSKKGSKFKLIKRIFIVLIILTLISILPARQIYQASKDFASQGKAFSEAYKGQNLDQMISQTSKMKSSLQSIDMWSYPLIWTSLIPFVGGYYQDLRHFTSAGIEELTATKTLLDALIPSKAELGFNGTPQPGSDRVSQGIKILEKSLPNLDKVEPNFKKAAEDVQNIDVNKYPDTFRGKPVKLYVKTLKDFIIGADVALKDARPALEVAPSALGVNGDKNYLLLFQNDKEIRSTGGFLTAFATLNVHNGKISATGSDDIYRLDERLIQVCNQKVCGNIKPPAQIVKYLPEADGRLRGTWSMRDSNTSPDVATSAAQFERLYSLLGQGINFDGIIFIDTQVVEDLISVTGPITVNGTEYSAKTDQRCNCPNVIYELEKYSEVAAAGANDRKAVLGELMQQILKNLLGADTAKIPAFVETIVTLANEKHVLFYMHDQNTQAALAKLNWTGEIKPYDGDYLAINDNNYAGGKSNLYVEQTVTQDISKTASGIDKKITIEYKNPQAFNTWLNAINLDYIRFYVPKGAKLVSSKGSRDPVNTFEDLGKTVFDGFIQVRPQNSVKLEIEYTVPIKVTGDYKLLIQKQPGAKDFHYIIKSGGVTKADFNLSSDKEIKFGI